MWANDEFKEKLKTEMQLVATAYETFKHVQFTQSEDMTAFKQAKRGLNERLAALNELLNRRLHKATTSIPYEDWLASHQPFHWLAEFYQIIHDNGGFDVIIGNPPYVEYNKKDKKTGKTVSEIYKIVGYTTEPCGNLYAYIIERCYSISHNLSVTGYIIPSASICTPRMRILYELLAKTGYLWTSIWDERPSKLFEGVDQQLCIHISRISANNSLFITKMNHWSTELRMFIFQNIDYIQYSIGDFIAGVPPKIQEKLEANILHKIFQDSSKLCRVIDTIDSNSLIYYRNAGGRYWRLVKGFPTYFKSTTCNTTTTEKILKVTSGSKKMIVATLSSSLFYWFWRVSSNCRHLTNREIESFPLTDNIEFNLVRLNSLCDIYEESLERNKKRTITQNKNTGEIIQDFYFCKLSKHIIDEIDKTLAECYNFTEEELDFIINYDIKYRMGEELNEE